MTDKLAILRRNYWSKADALLLPITGIRDTSYELKSFLYWQTYSVEECQLILCFSYEHYEPFLMHFQTKLLPEIDKRSYITESFDFPGKTVVIMDISDWAKDIALFMEGKYSKFSATVKDMIRDFHTEKIPILDAEGNPDFTLAIPIDILAVIHPDEHRYEFRELLRDGGKILTPMEYIAKHYEFPLEELRKVGEIGSVFDKEKETLTIEEAIPGQFGTEKTRV
jgi:hypothetical protein